MKKLLLYTTLFAISLGFEGCSGWLDVNSDPNNPTDVSEDIIMPASQAEIAAYLGGDIYNYSAFFAQYVDQAPESNQYNAIADYDIDQDIFWSSYRGLYAQALEDLETVRTKAKNSNKWGDYMVATTLRAYAYQIIVDNIDEAPYSEALQGTSVTKPKYDGGETIYKGVIAEIDSAEAKVNAASDKSISQDLMLSKDVNQWIGFANALKLRMLMRGSEKNDNSAAIKKLVNEGNFFTGDVTFASFSNQTGKYNPWYGTMDGLSANNYVGSYPLVSFMKSTNDPRISNIYTKSTKLNDYAGEVPNIYKGGYENAHSHMNEYYSRLNISSSSTIMGPTAPVYFFTQSDLQFLLAEAYVRFFSDNAKAKAAYQAAIVADLSTRGLDTGLATNIYGSTSSQAWPDNGADTQKLKLIYMQKWVAMAMVDPAEGWAEMRRTDVPSTSSVAAQSLYDNPTSDAYTAGDIIIPYADVLGSTLIKRVWYPASALALNPNAPKNDTNLRTTNVWWDVK
jgi:hypothetical protein